MGNNVSIGIAFIGGLASFISPCVLPLFPSYISFLTGMSFEDMTGVEDRARVQRIAAAHSFLFILGFSIVFVRLGASATYIGGLVNQYQTVLQKIGGIIVIILGIHFTGLFNIGFLLKEKRLHIKNKPLGYLGSFLVGLTFAIGWTPCIGPILGSILMYATTTNDIIHGMGLLFIYSLGLGIPFLISAIAINTFLINFRRISSYMNVITIGSGVFLVIIGLLIFTNNFSMLSQLTGNWFS